MERHPQTIAQLRLLEEEIQNARKLSMSGIRRSFDPRFCAPYTINVLPSREITLEPTSEQETKLAFVISDVHMRGEAHPRTDDLLRLYWLIRKLQAPVVHNGDYFDLLVWKANFPQIQAANHLIMNAIDFLPKVLQIVGNHDGALDDVARRREKLQLNVYLPPAGTYFDGKVYIEHGHQADRHSVKGKKSGDRIVKVLTFLEKKIFSRLWPNFMHWMELAERLWFAIKSQGTGRDEWKIYKQDAVLDRVREVFKQCQTGRASMGLEQFSKEKPMIYIRGHDHGAGFSFTIDELVKKVYYDEELGGRVRYFSSGSWKGEEDADLLVIDYGQPDRMYVYPFVWKPTYGHFVAFREQHL